MCRRLCSLLLVMVLIQGLGPALARGQEPGTPSIDTAAVMGPPLGAALDGEALEQATEDLTYRMACPVCQGQSIASSASIVALAMREEIREFLAQGYTEEQIIAYFEKAYGEYVRLEPKAQGFNLVVWFAPALLFLAGGGAVALRLRSRSKKRLAEEPPAEELPVAEEGAGSEPAAATASAASDPELDSYLEQVRREVGS